MRQGGGIVRGRIVIGLIMLVALFQTQKAFCDGKIVKVVPGYVLIDSDQNIGEIGEVIKVYRTTSGGPQNVGTVELARFKNGRAAAKIVKQRPGLKIKAGDFLEGFGSEESVMDDLFDDSDSDTRHPSGKRAARKSGASQDIVMGPIPGATILPAKGRSVAVLQGNYWSAKSQYDIKGDLQDFNEGFEEVVDPKMTISALNVDLMHAFTDKHCLGVSVPMILGRKLAYNVSNDFEDLVEMPSEDGLTGIGDITLWGRMLVNQTEYTRIALDAGFKLATGSTIEDLKIEDIENGFTTPTGTGNTGFHLGINGDRFMGNSLTSFAISYVMYSEGEFEMEDGDFKMKHGNELNATVRMSLKMSPKMSVGVEAALYKSAEYKVEGKKVDDSESSGFVVAPLVGFRFGAPRNPVNVFGGYAFTLSGVNYYKMSGLTVGAVVGF
jgi:hypothetical protein